MHAPPCGGAHFRYRLNTLVNILTGFQRRNRAVNEGWGGGAGIRPNVKLAVPPSSVEAG